MLGCYNDRLFPEKYTVKDHICTTKPVQRILLMPPLKSNQFNLAVVSVKRSITQESLNRRE